MPILAPIIAFFSSFFLWMGKHPILAKAFFFSIFASLITEAIDWLLGFVTPYLTVYPSVYAIFCSFGLFDAVNLFVSILLSAWGVKQVIAFIRG